jgi:hypothetical protein
MCVRGLPAVVVLVLLLVTSLGSTAGNPTTVEGPLLGRGDYWTYETNTSFAAGLTLDGRVTLTVTDRSTITGEGIPFDAYNLSLSGGGTASGTFVTQFGSMNGSGSWILTGWELMEVRGLKRLWTVVDLEANGTLDAKPFPLPFALRVQNTTRYRIEADAWHFPLQVGNSTVVAERMDFTEDVGFFAGFPTTPRRTSGVARWNVTYTLGGPVRINTLAGAFDAYPINETYPDGTSTRMFFAPVAGNYARTESRNQTSELGTTDLVAYRYQALEPPRFLGLTLDQWAIAVVVIAGGATGFVWWWRKRRRRGTDEPVIPPE